MKPPCSLFALAFTAAVLSLAVFSPPSFADGVEVNGGFETGDALGWTEWQAPWGAQPAIDYAWSVDPFDGESSLYLSASSGSFGVYQEFCVEPGVQFDLEWSWMGKSNGNGWWEVLVVDGPYSYEAVDAPADHPETLVASKWELGFGGAFPEPSAEWESSGVDLVPSSDTVTVVLKCGSTEGGLVEAWFDEISVTHDSDIVELTEVEPLAGKTEGAERVRVLGRNLLDGAAITFGGKEMTDLVRLSTCAIEGTTPPGEAGFVDVAIATAGGSFTLENGFRYVDPPAIESVEPDSGPVEGGTEVTVTGTSFLAADPSEIQVMFGQVVLADVTVVDETTITATAPPGEAGAVDVTVTTPFGEAVAAGAFTYAPASGKLFLRGNCNGDAEVNITDAIFALGFLFLGGEEPPCLEACNANDDPELNITDGISILNFLFLGGASPAPPFPDCGTDPTDSLGCASAHPSC